MVRPGHRRMKRLIPYAFLLLLAVITLPGCATSRKNLTELKGLMLLDNKQLDRNKPYYSKHNKKAKNVAFRKYKNNHRQLYGERR